MLLSLLIRYVCIYSNANQRMMSSVIGQNFTTIEIETINNIFKRLFDQKVNIQGLELRV